MAERCGGHPEAISARGAAARTPGSRRRQRRAPRVTGVVLFFLLDTKVFTNLFLPVFFNFGCKDFSLKFLLVLDVKLFSSIFSNYFHKTFTSKLFPLKFPLSLHFFS